MGMLILYPEIMSCLEGDYVPQRECSHHLGLPSGKKRQEQGAKGRKERRGRGRRKVRTGKWERRTGRRWKEGRQGGRQGGNQGGGRKWRREKQEGRGGRQGKAKEQGGAGRRTGREESREVRERRHEKK